MEQQTLITELLELTQHLIAKAQTFQSLPDQALTQRPHARAWNALECLEHLNRYGLFYIPEFERALSRTKTVPADTPFRTSWLGGYLSEMMRQEGKQKKTMKTFASKNPLGISADRQILETFIAQQKQMLHLLEQARTRSIRSRVSTTLPLLRLPLGDALRFVIYHNQRHVRQAERAVALVVDIDG
ncbi:MAG: DinB family protein [Bernardetiaceae bacterium]